MSKTLPIKDLATINKIKDYYIKEQNYRDLLLFLLAINTGLKLNFLLGLNVNDVKRKNSIEIPYEVGNGNATPNNIKKEIFFNNEVKQLIKNLTQNSNAAEPLFKSKRGTRLERTTVFRNFKRVCKTLMLDDKISILSLRKTFGFHYYLKTKDLMFLQNFFNQSSISSTINFIGINKDFDSSCNLTLAVNL
ncbi:tyrosine-type recombinase/integrase [bacterium]|nr:tyrosine-type recombinase/integrase [bacterium]